MTEGLQFDKPLEKYYKQCLVKKIALNTASNVIDAIRATHNDEPVAVKEYRMYWECIYTFINTDGEKCERAIKTNQYHKENEFCINWLKEQKATDLEKTTWFNLFSIR